MGEVKMQNLPGVKTNYDMKPSKSVRMSDIKDASFSRQVKSMIHNCRKVGEELKQEMWKGERCFIIGGGKSVKNFDLSKLQGENIIGVNMAFRLIEPDIIYAMDARLWGWIEEDMIAKGDSDSFNKSKALKVWSDITPFPLPEDIIIAPSLGRPGMSDNIKEGVGCGSNSGYGALNLALLLGASEIYLIGFDFEGKRWHRGYPEAAQVSHADHLACYIDSAEDIKKMFPDQRIINLNKKSKLACFEFGDMPKDVKSEKVIKEVKVVKRKNKKDTDPIFVSYFTKDNGYDKYAKDLIETMRVIDIDYDVQAVQNRGKWDINTKLKPGFILEMMKKYPDRPIVWVDADALFNSVPDIFYTTQADVAVHYYKEGAELISNLVYFSGSKKSVDLLKKWKKVCEDPKNLQIWDQVLLARLIKEDKKLKVELLPPEYCYILGLNHNPKSMGKPVVEQRQASRKLKV